MFRNVTWPTRSHWCEQGVSGAGLQVNFSRVVYHVSSVKGAGESNKRVTCVLCPQDTWRCVCDASNHHSSHTSFVANNTDASLVGNPGIPMVRMGSGCGTWEIIFIIHVLCFCFVDEIKYNLHIYIFKYLVVILSSGYKMGRTCFSEPD